MKAGKKQVILEALVLALSVAIYLNWQFAKADNDFSITDSLDVSANYGEAEYVNTQNGDEQKDGTASADGSSKEAEETAAKKSSSKSKASSKKSEKDENMGTKEQASTAKSSTKYFTEARTNRTKTRDEALDKLQKSLKDASITADEKEKLTAELSYIVKAIESESKIESLVKAKGFEDCLVYLNDEKADIVVKTEGLTPETANQIKEIVIREASVEAENISIVEVN